MHQEKQEEKKKKKWLLLLLLLLIALIAIGITVWVVFFRDASPALSPDYAPVDLEQNAIPVDDDEAKLDRPAGGGSVSLTYSNEVGIDLSDAVARVYFINPAKSNENMVVQIVIREDIVVQSGTLKPGNKVYELALLDGAAEKLSAGGYEGKFVVDYYDPESGERAIVNTEIPVRITVTN